MRITLSLRQEQDCLKVSPQCMRGCLESAANELLKGWWFPVVLEGELPEGFQKRVMARCGILGVAASSVVLRFGRTEPPAAAIAARETNCEARLVR
jgi:hypothetical protein